MRRQWTTRRKRTGTHGAFTLLESVIAVLLVGLLMVAALRSVGSAKRREMHTLDQVRGEQLAADLLNEILLKPYAEPVSASVFGPEPGEAGNRSLFDDVDDYAGWNASPPTDRSGAPITGFTGWTQQASVQWVNPTTLATTTASNTGLKRMTVTISKNGKTIATMAGYRSIAWVDTIPSPSAATDNHAPVAVATSPNLTRRVGETVTFAGSSSSDPDGDYLSYVWNFGNGTSATGANTATNFTAAGNYVCTLTVYDGKGGVGIAALTVVITP